MMSRRSFFRLGAGALVCSASSAAAVEPEPIWIAAPEVSELTIIADEIVAVGSHLRVLDPATGRERRNTPLGRPRHAEGPVTIAATASALVFGWYLWHEDVYVLCADPRSLTVRWRRRIPIVEAERENVPQIFPLVRPEGVFVFVSNKFSENLFRLRPDNGEIIWSRYIPRYGIEAPLYWHSNRLLARSRVTRGAQQAGDLHAVDPSTGATHWRIRLEGHEDWGGDTMLIVGNRAYIAAPVPPGEACRLHIVDLTAGAIIKSLTIDRLSEPFAYHDGVVYFGGSTPTAWDAAREQIIWRTNLRERQGKVIYISHEPALDIARRRIYLGESEHSFFVLSSSDGTVLNRVDVRRGRTSPNIMTVYGAYRLRLLRDLLLVGAGDQRLLAFATASL
jgi:outer membrane protein assembly factor BamB